MTTATAPAPQRPGTLVIPTWLDRVTGSVTMYRLVLVCLLAVLVESLIASAVGRIAYDVPSILVNGLAVVLATYLSNRLLALVFRVKPHSESSFVTALILLFLFQPSLTAPSIASVALAGLLASASKYLLAVRGRHVFNPAAIAAVVMSIAVPSSFPGWWVGAPWLLPVVAVAAFALLWRTRKLPMGILFSVVAIAGVMLVSVSNGLPAGTALQNAVLSSPVIFFAGFMLSEPLTLPPRRWQQLALAVVVGVLFAVPFHAGPVYGSYELALVIGNLLAFLVGQRRAVRLEFEGRSQLTPTTWELAFRPRRAVTFRPGQYMELSLPHAGADVRGQRRTFSIASHAGDAGAVRFGLKVATPSSTFKTRLLSLDPGDVISATTVGGDFLLPRDGARPLLLVAGGIGITPFVSQLTSLHASADERDIVLVYSASSTDELAYLQRLADLGVRGVVLAPSTPDELPLGWTYGGAGPLTPEILAEAVPDARGRHAFVSGPPRLVHAVRHTLRTSGVRRVTTDAFSGY